jgi:histidinol-phosphatase (PHP family)
LKYNLHTHTRFSDGSDAPEKYIEAAAEQGFSVLGISDHSPVPFENNFAIREEKLAEYIATLSGIRHPASLFLLLSLEIDYIPGLTRPFGHYRENFPFDYLIGSVHLVRNDASDALWFIDGPKIETYDDGLKNVFGGDIRKGVASYYRQVQEMIANEHPDIVGHMDKIKMYNRGRYFSEEDGWYEALMDETLELAAEVRCVLEVNTRGLYKKRSDTYFPGPAFLKKIRDRKIPVTVSSDAHRPEELGNGLEEAKKFLKEMGFREEWCMTREGWVGVGL